MSNNKAAALPWPAELQKKDHPRTWHGFTRMVFELGLLTIPVPALDGVSAPGITTLAPPALPAGLPLTKDEEDVEALEGGGTSLVAPVRASLSPGWMMLGLLTEEELCWTGALELILSVDERQRASRGPLRHSQQLRRAAPPLGRAGLQQFESIDTYQSALSTVPRGSFIFFACLCLRSMLQAVLIMYKSISDEDSLGGWGIIPKRAECNSRSVCQVYAFLVFPAPAALIFFFLLPALKPLALLWSRESTSSFLTW